MGGNVLGVARRGWLWVVDLGLVLLLGVTLVSGFAQVGDAGEAQPKASEPIYDYKRAIRETVWVDIGLDGDHDGKNDRVAADIIRPREATGKVPVIMDASPYFRCCGRGIQAQMKKYAAGKPVDFPLFYDNYFVPRGYAVVLVDLAGTNRSTGCTDVGGPSDIASARAVIDWLNGRATGYAEPNTNKKAEAGWATGAVGMIGKSWDGTIANGVAATGVDGLKTIVPISAISSWYDYYRASGATFRDGPLTLAHIDGDETACKQVDDAIGQGAQPDGDFNAMWAERDYVADAAKVKASVFISHGLNDLNVRTINFGQWWAALPPSVEKKIWLAQTGHVDPFDYRRTVWVDTLHKWFDHYLLGVDNGIDRAPQADIERAPDQWTTDTVWPARGTATTVTLSDKVFESRTGTFTDNPEHGETDWTKDDTNDTDDHVSFTTNPLAKDVRISGTPSITVTAMSSKPEARLTAILVDLGPTKTRDFSAKAEGIKNLDTTSCFGASTPDDSACYRDTAADPLTTTTYVFSRGWADLGHYASLTERHELTPGADYPIKFNLATTDHVVPAGHRLELIVAGTDRGVLDPVDGRPELTIDPGRSTLFVPLTGAL